jgi:CRP/FNR family cyclic AMP-dependent transcriptional regulator
MLLVLDGEVMIESIVVSRTEPITVTVLGPGNLIGEMGLLDGEPRSMPHARPSAWCAAPS